jgi:IclR family acetate operon transcriptional repressor
VLFRSQGNEGAQMATNNRVGSVDRALNLLDSIAAGDSNGMTLAALTKLTKYSKSSILALLRTLADHGYLRVTQPGPRYLPGLALIKLGDQASAVNPLATISRPILVALSLATGLTSRIAINDDGFPVFISRIDGPGTVRFHTPLGIRELPHINSAGKAILTTLAESEVDRVCAEAGLVAKTPNTITTIEQLKKNLKLASKNGYAIDDEEDAQGVFCIGSAFFGHHAKCVGAISVTGLKGGLRKRDVEKVGKLVAQHAGMMNTVLQGIDIGDSK